ncbi:protein kinase domain-containing protein [Sorangium sp. So ce1024]|uniref:serine/threonine-protein kinase n=1 Tax=Sorangium sp. So ce1024 TaxID=3133327 RepID=UPI003F126DFA
MTLHAGRYESLRAIASGGMATVYLGRALGAGGFERLVALKMMHPHIAAEPEFVAMFLDEARLAARVRHPNVVATFDLVEDPLCLVMEYIEGPSLHLLLRTCARAKRPVPLGIALRIFLDVLAGLHAAHELTGSDGEPLHLVHRDVSPQNVLVGVDGVARITDFGVARAETRLMSTRGNALKGKLAYMAPEQIRAQQVDRRSDVYSAGVVLWEMLTEERLFKADNDGALIAQILQGPPTGPRGVMPSVPAAIDLICLRALSADPNGRFPTAAAFAEALEEAAAQTPGLAVSSPRAVEALIKEVGLRGAPDGLGGPISARGGPASGSGPRSARSPLSQRAPRSEPLPVSQRAPWSEPLPFSQRAPRSEPLPFSQRAPRSEPLPFSQRAPRSDTAVGAAADLSGADASASALGAVVSEAVARRRQHIVRRGVIASLFAGALTAGVAVFFVASERTPAALEAAESVAAPTLPSLLPAPVADDAPTPAAAPAQPDGAVAQPGGAAAQPDAAVAQPDAAVAQPGGAAAQPDAAVAQPDEAVAQPGAPTQAPALVHAAQGSARDGAAQKLGATGTARAPLPSKVVQGAVPVRAAQGPAPTASRAAAPRPVQRATPPPSQPRTGRPNTRTTSGSKVPAPKPTVRSSAAPRATTKAPEPKRTAPPRATSRTPYKPSGL